MFLLINRNNNNKYPGKKVKKFKEKDADVSSTQF